MSVSCPCRREAYRRREIRHRELRSLSPTSATMRSTWSTSVCSAASDRRSPSSAQRSSDHPAARPLAHVTKAMTLTLTRAQHDPVTAECPIWRRPPEVRTFGAHSARRKCALRPWLASEQSPNCRSALSLHHRLGQSGCVPECSNHWDDIYASHSSAELSWHQGDPKISLRLIRHRRIRHRLLPIVLADRTRTRGARHTLGHDPVIPLGGAPAHMNASCFERHSEEFTWCSHLVGDVTARRWTISAPATVVQPRRRPPPIGLVLVAVAGVCALDGLTCERHIEHHALSHSPNQRCLSTRVARPNTKVALTFHRPDQAQLIA